MVTADSMQVYRGLPLLTNQPTAAELLRVPHHLVGIVDPTEECSAAAFAQLAHAVIDGLRAQQRPVVLEGGSGLYLRAALGGLSFRPAPDPAIRAGLEERLLRLGLPSLVAELRGADPHAAERIDLRNPRRVLRALEVALQAESVTATAEATNLWLPGSRYPHLLFLLSAERAWLRRRVDERVDEMLAAGALAELAAVRSGGPLSRTLQQAIGVRELSEHLDGRLTLAQAAEQTKARTRRLVRRQLTWMRKLPGTATIAVAGRPASAVADEIVALLHRAIAGGPR